MDGLTQLEQFMMNNSTNSASEKRKKENEKSKMKNKRRKMKNEK